MIFGDFSCPCALVLSVPLTFFSSIGLASKRGILIKGGNYLEKLKDIEAVVNYKDIKISETDIKDYKEISGKGVSALYKEKNILVGNKKLMEDNNIAVENIGEEDGTTVYIALNNEYIGSLHLADEIKNDSSKTLEKLKKMNIKTTFLILI